MKIQCEYRKNLAIPVDYRLRIWYNIGITYVERFAYKAGYDQPSY